MNYTYIVECSDGSYYTGWTNNLEKRIGIHNSGKGGKYTRSRNPVRLVYYEEFSTKEEAQAREYEIKKLTRKKKEMLIKEGKQPPAEQV
ncbi:MAG: GIY-YIG nuclease family protein [Ruminococcaceae bacterium]|nr:GIY-YIG nuclease family protein [Oscillospiraceae bacterium]